VNFIKKYKSLTLFFGGIVLAIFLSKLPWINNFLTSLHAFGYLGALIGGIFYVYTFTVGFGVMIITILSRSLPLVPLVLISGFGAVMGDSLIFKLTKDNFKDEIKNIYKAIDKKQTIKNTLYRKKWKWILPVLGVIILGTPFPNELGVMFLGVTNMNKKVFVMISFFLNSISLYFLINILN